ncbi:unnamed protein product [Cuscuta epithymum]|uniref:Pectinesterase inhibitor domain-containing protein n=1 Tax=Cuscuta epithymum TaxID=186058 RepID=A0AAV0EWY3_9ASTE|nr:unnamed protein product [Cuscuta epithymum]
MAAHHRRLFLLLISALLFLSATAQYSYDDEDGEAADAPVAVSYISASPVASPSAAPAPAPSSEGDIDASSSDQQSLPLLQTSKLVSSTPGGDEAAADGASYGTMKAVAEPSVKYDVAAAGRSGVNKFVHSMLVASVRKTDNFISNVIQKRLSDPSADSYTKDCMQTCKEVYEDSVGAMKKTMEDIQDGNYFKANVDVSAMSNDADTCKECVKQVIGDDPEFEKFSKWVDGVVDACLGKITGINS